MKRFLIALLIVLVIAGVVGAGYYFSTKKSAPETGVVGALPAPAEGLPQSSSTTTTVSPAAETLSPVGTSGAALALSLVSSEKFVSFSVATSGLVYGISPDGKIFSVDKKGVSSFLSSASIDNFSGADFSSDGRKLIAFWGDNENRQFSVFDTASSTWQPLPLGTISAGWKPQAHVLAYLQDKNGVKNLYTWDLDKPKVKAQSLLQLFFEDISVGYLAADKIFLSEKSTGLAGNSFWIFDTGKKILSSVITEVRGSLLKWNSAVTESLSFSGNINGAGGTLRLANALGGTISRFDKLLTLPSKCFFAPDVFSPPPTVSTSTKSVKPIAVLENFLYCAVPRDQKTLSQSLLPDSYEQRSLFTADDIYRINTDDGLISTIFNDAGRSFDIEKPEVQGTTFFFINRYDQNLYALPVPKE